MLQDESEYVKNARMNNVSGALEEEHIYSVVSSAKIKGCAALNFARIRLLHIIPIKKLIIG